MLGSSLPSYILPPRKQHFFPFSWLPPEGTKLWRPHHIMTRANRSLYFKVKFFGGSHRRLGIGQGGDRVGWPHDTCLLGAFLSSPPHHTPGRVLVPHATCGASCTAGRAVLLGVLTKELEPVTEPIPQVGQVLPCAGLCNSEERSLRLGGAKKQAGQWEELPLLPSPVPRPLLFSLLVEGLPSSLPLL